MLTPSANQYLRPEYLSPLPTTLDAKKSPLALLAQTCNNIGADTPNAKSLIPPLEKSSSNNTNNSSNKESSSISSKDSHREKSTPHQSEDKSSFKPYESIKKEEPCSDNEKGGGGGGFRTPTSKSCSPAVSSTGSVNSGKSSPHSTGINNGGNNNNNSSDCSNTSKSSSSSDTTTTSVTSSIANPTVSASLHSQHNRISIGCGNMFVEVNHHESALPKDHGLSAHIPMGYKPGQLIPGLPPSAGLLSSLSNCTGCTQIMGHGIPVDAASVNSPYPQGITTQSGSPLKPGSYPTAGSALSPYVAYARVKTITGGTTLVPICRDPYCTNCQISMQNAQQLVGTTCPSGCTQCNHEKAAAAAAGLGAPHLSSLSLMPGLPGPNTPVSLSSGLYTHSMLTQRPYVRDLVCNWIAGDAYCGKRFSSSDELFQHLRTHTNLSASDSATLSLLSPSLSLSSAAGLGACHLHYSMAPSLTSPAGLHRTYPTSLSPVSSLSASRYHPYKPPLSSLTGAPLSPFPPHPSLGASPYFTPYAMYGQRLGTAVHP